MFIRLLHFSIYRTIIILIDTPDNDKQTGSRDVSILLILTLKKKLSVYIHTNNRYSSYLLCVIVIFIFEKRLS